MPAERSRVVLARAGSPQRNARAILDAWGGVESLVGPEDVVVFKVNAQWHAQGMTNTDVLAELVRAVLERPGGFRGEVVLADNHHCQEDDSRGWTTSDRNGRFNYNELVQHFRDAGHANVGKVHWRDAGPNPDPWQFDAAGGPRTTGTAEGPGYRWQLDECHVTPEGNRCAMTWPVFALPRSGEVVDLRDGALRFINVSSLNHHSRYGGVTASIKNLMGVVDMTCGFHGPEPPGFFNTHYVGMRPSHAVWRWADRAPSPVRRAVHAVLPEEKALDFQHTGGALGHWMRTVRRPDLHVVTAEWIGWGSRTRPDMSARPGATLAARDPVTLDAVAARELLLPATRAAGAKAEPFLRHNDPDLPEGAFHLFLEQARHEIGGRLDPDGAELVRL
ncbi:MAG: DUF362 domain-containing protein [Acidobacteria bacterium]|nr:DUF362 domain-containing protein [Acidobacteriota bacterium]